ncbi:MAG: hypothetical protein ACI4IF_07835 [Acutalibacteraceae bacterium]
MKDKTALYLIKRNPLFYIAFIAFFPLAILSTGYFNSFRFGTWNIDIWSEDFGAYWELYSVALIGIYIFIFFMFFSFEYIYLVKNSGVAECAEAINGGSLKLYKQQYIILIILSFIEFLISLLFFVYAYFRWNILHTEYLIYAVKFAFINVFLISVLASSVGVLICSLLNRVTGYFVMLLISVFQIIVFRFNLSSLVSNSITAKNTYLCEIINIFTSDTDYPIIPQFGYSVQPYKLFTLLFWIVLCVFALVLLSAVKTRNIKKLALSTGSLIVSVICVIGAITPSSRLYINNSYPTSAIVGDIKLVGSQKSEKADFSVLKYDVLLNIKQELSAKVTVSINNKTPGDYKFTLWSAFNVLNITDEKGDELSFSRDGCYITVHGKSKNEKLTFEYKGFSYRFFSNTQGVYLPGHFPYYPLPGFLNVIYENEQGVGFINNQFKNSVEFNVKVLSPLKIFSNLESNGKNEFEGKSTTLYIYGGFVDEKEINGVKVIYPYFDGQSRPNILEQYINIGLENKILKKGDIVFVGPRLISGADERIMLFENGCYVNSVLSLKSDDEYAPVTKPVYF